MILLKLTLLQALSTNITVPEMSVAWHPIKYLYFKQLSSAHCEPQGMIRWNPQTALWNVAVGGEYNGAGIEIGHTSHHDLWGSYIRPNSFDYVKVSYQRVLK